MTRFISIILVVFSVLFFMSCTDSGKGEPVSVDPNTIYLDYKIGGAEGDSNITILLQYRYAGPHGPTVLLDTPAKVSVDGQELIADSSKYTGAYYEWQIPIDIADGKHTIVYTDSRNRVYKEEVDIRTMSLLTPVPDTFNRQDWVIELKGLDKKDYVRVVLTDTSRFYDGINRMDTVTDGRIIISRKYLETLADGDVFLELTREIERPVSSSPPEGGVVSITYSLRREFFLKDSL